MPRAYDAWSREDLIARLQQLEQRPEAPGVHQEKTQTSESQQSRTRNKPFDFYAHPRRKIALKFCYSGWEYNGLTVQEDPTPLPTVESVLFGALAHGRLIDPEKGFDGCGWERCGRTDKGVSSAGQVVSLWVRSAIGDAQNETTEPGPSMSGISSAEMQDEMVSPNQESPQESQSSEDQEVQEDVFGTSFDFMGDLASEPPTNASAPKANLRPNQTELSYLVHINRLLPPTIRILAWSPVEPTFSARYNCRSRHYKYFFSSENLDLAAMRDGAARLIGEHDFRNMCKVDPGKQLTTFRRKILKAEIDPIEGGQAGMYVFNLIGTAFLYNQVRHIMSLLFLIGAHLEPPSIITSLLNVDPANPYPPSRTGEPTPPIVQTKPEYQMADPLPLVLWECAFKEEDVKWQIDESAAEDEGNSKVKERAERAGEAKGVYKQLHAIQARSAVHTTLNQHFLRAAEQYHPPPPPRSYLATTAIPRSNSDAPKTEKMFTIPLGGGAFRRVGRYVPVLERKRLESVEVMNERWRLGKGARRKERQGLGGEEIEDDK